MDQNQNEIVKSEEAKEPKPLWIRIVNELWPYVVIVVGFFLLFTYILVNARIPSGSMENTIMTGDRLFGNRLAYLNSDPERYDIVIFKYPDDESRLFVKRVIGMPGDTVEIRDGKVYINGSDEPLSDSFCPEKPTGNYGPFEVPEGYYFMLGDNREHSNDSRFWMNKYVARDKIVGKVGVRYWPLTKIGPVKSNMNEADNW